MIDTLDSAARKTELADARITEVSQRTTSAVAAMNAYNAQMVILRTTIDGPTSWTQTSPVSGPVTLLVPGILATSKVFVTVLTQESGLKSDTIRYDITPGVKVVFTVTSPLRTTWPVTPRINVVIYIGPAA